MLKTELVRLFEAMIPILREQGYAIDGMLSDQCGAALDKAIRLNLSLQAICNLAIAQAEREPKA
jgi:hypothetical protein